MLVQHFTSKPPSGQSIPTSPSPPPPSTTAPRRSVEVSKLRSSCDGCGTAKVKCDRGHPECSRCAALGLNCVYGPSRKSGKPPRKRPGTDLGATPAKRICASGASESRTTPGFEKPAPADFSDLVTDIIPTSCDVNFALGFTEQSQFSPAMYPSVPLEEWPQLGSWEDGLAIPSVSALGPVNSTVQTSSDSHESHSCPRESYEIFRDLVCPSPFLHAPQSNSVTVSARLDQVLHFNKSAIDRLRRVLKCRCAKSGHRAMVHASIVSRILIWYQQAAGWTGRVSPSSSSSSSPSPPPLSETEAGASALHLPSLAQTTGFTVADVPVSMGTFSTGDQMVQAAFRDQLILGELKMTAGLIDMFISQDSGESANGVADLYSHLGIWLRSEHSRTVRLLRSRLGALNQTIES